MDLRLRRLISTKRGKSKSEASKTDKQSFSPRPGSSKWSLRALTPQPQYQPSNRSDSVTIPLEDANVLQSIPYDAVTAGKAPTFSSRPVKGNGPIKLQASRRLSSGDLLATTQDPRRMLDDIREGEYIIGQREKRNPRNPSLQDNTPPTPALSTSQSCTESFQSPRTPPETPALPHLSCSSSQLQTPLQWPTNATCDGLGIATNPVTSLEHRFGLLNVSDSDPNRNLRLSRTSTSTSPSFHFREEQNATIAALWKAEYKRLIELYGRDHVERRMPSLCGSTEMASLPRMHSNAEISLSAISLEPLPQPHFERSALRMRRLSSTSAISNAHHDDQSDASSNKRASLISSCAGSSLCTTHTGATDHDAVMTRDDIHKIVNEMRSNYLQALNKDSPASARSGQSLRKKRRTKHGNPVIKSPTGKLLAAERQTWHGDDVHSSVQPRKRKSTKTRTSQPITNHYRLTPVEASPPSYEKRPTVRLQRADSTTLGSVTAEVNNGAQVLEASKEMQRLLKKPLPVTPDQHTASTTHMKIYPDFNFV